MRPIAWTACAALLVAGCSMAAPLRIASQGAAFTPGASYVLVAAAPDASAPDPVEAQVDAVLRAAGLRPATSSEAADYLVQVAYSDRPASVGGYVPAGSDGGEPTWRQREVKRLPWTLFRRGDYSLRLQAFRRDGALAREAIVHRFHFRGDARKAAPRLVAAVREALATPQEERAPRPAGSGG